MVTCPFIYSFPYQAADSIQAITQTGPSALPGFKVHWQSCCGIQCLIRYDVSQMPLVVHFQTTCFIHVCVQGVTYRHWGEILVLVDFDKFSKAKTKTKMKLFIFIYFLFLFF